VARGCRDGLLESEWVRTLLGANIEARDCGDKGYLEGPGVTYCQFDLPKGVESCRVERLAPTKDLWYLVETRECRNFRDSVSGGETLNDEPEK
jgi:hypothetical protein